MSILFAFYIISLLITIVSSKRSLPIAYTFIVLFLSIISFFYVPSETADLYRLFEAIEFYGDMGLEWVLENECNLNPLTSLFLYSFSYIGDLRFFTSFIVFVTYGFSFLLLYRVTKFYSLKKPIIILLTMFLLFNWNYLLVASNCRIFMLYAIIAFLFYMEFIEDKLHKTAFFVYIAALLFHYGILLVLIPRFLLYLYKPTNKKIYLVVLIMFSLLAYKGMSYLSLFYGALLDRIQGYQDYKVFGVWQFLNSLVCVLVCCFYALYKRVKLYDIKKFCILFWLIIIPIFLQLSNFQVIYRESNFVASLSVVLFSHIFSKSQSSLMQMVIGIQAIASILYSFVYVYSHIDFIFVL